jgi:hypothetical protein
MRKPRHSWSLLCPYSPYEELSYKAIGGIPACDQVTGLNEFAELTTPYNTLVVIFRFPFSMTQVELGHCRNWWCEQLSR